MPSQGAATRATAIWNAEKKGLEQKRIYIGIKDSETGDFFPNKNYINRYGNGQEILSCAWYCCPENEALYLCEQWTENS